MVLDPTSITECRLKPLSLRVFVIGVNYYTVHDTSPSIEVVYCAGSTPEEAISRKKAKKARARANGALTALAQPRPAAKVREHDVHVLVCNSGDCKKRGSKEVRKVLKEELRERGMIGDVRVDSVDCLGLCKHGPNAVVYPGGTWYLGLTKSDVPEVVERHLEGGEPVDHLAAGFRPRKKKRK
jgi:(2Fe-2S) ferredoxin